MCELDDKVAVITGGSRGLGRAIAGAMAERGATVVVASRKAEACEVAAAEIAEQTGARALGMACHVGRWAECDALVERVYEELGRIDVLVNNAGSSPLYPSLDQVSEELFDKVMAVNLKGHFRISALVAPRMAADHGGSIINVSSTSSVSPNPMELPYGAAKAGLSTLTVGFARAYGPSVRVNTIMPGPFLTDISQAWDMEAFAERARIGIPLQRAGEPGEIVGAALYLASDASSYVSGTTITVDGGMTARPG
jgi:NAD(P)-dependent dehydrogenase (short-subunit alcohol dehydrogenase family)